MDLKCSSTSKKSNHSINTKTMIENAKKLMLEKDYKMKSYKNAYDANTWLNN